MQQTKIVTVDDLAALVPDGCDLAIVKDDTGTPTELVRALLRRGAKDLRLLTIPTGGYPADILIGAGCVARVETSGISLGEFGGAPRFMDAVRHAKITIRDATCPAVYAALQAGEKGLPFIPIRGILGSDVAANRADWKIIDNPLADGNAADPVLILPAINPDVVLLHVEKADRFGNAWIGRTGEKAIAAHAARATLITAEEIVDEDLMATEEIAAGCIAGMYVDAIAQAKQGCWPLGFARMYPRDDTHMQHYAKAARTDEGFAAYLQEHVFGEKARGVA